MANIIGTSEWPGMKILLVDAEPSASTGTPAPIGAHAQIDGQSGIWTKDGPLDTDWTLSSQAGEFASFTNDTQIAISGSSVTPIAWGVVNAIDPSVFDLLPGNTDIELKRSGVFSLRGQFTVLFSSGFFNSRTQGRGGMYVDDTGLGNWQLIRGTRGFGYHRNSTAGNDTIALERTVRLESGWRIRYGVQRVAGSGSLVFDDFGCSLILTRKSS